jgi:ABC-type amino acid transport substrate-binding protein/two-component sensor histidine kinase
MKRLALFFTLLWTFFLVSDVTAACTVEAAETAEHPIHAASEDDYPPYCIINERGEADGFSVELLRAVLNVMGHEVDFRIGPWDQVKKMLATGAVQVLPLVGRTPEREPLYDFTFPYLTMHGTIVVRADETAIRTLDDLAGRRVAVMDGDNAEEFLRRIDTGAEIVTTDTFEVALKELADGRHDAVVTQRLVALQLIKKAGLTNLRMIEEPLNDFEQSFCFAVREGDKKLLEVLNEGLSLVIADGTHRRLHTKWFGPIEAGQQRRARIVVGGDHDMPPYEFLDENGEPTGYNVELTRAIARQLGLEVSFRLGPWERTRAALKGGHIDLIHSMFYSPERDEEFEFTPAHAAVNYAVVVRAGTSMPGNLAELSGKTILVMEGDIMHDAARELGYGDRLLTAPTQEEALRRLAAGEGDCALTAKIPALYWIGKHGWNNLRVSDHAVRSTEMAYAAPKDQYQLVALFSEGLANLKATGEYRAIYAKWMGAYEPAEADFHEVLKRFLWILLPMVLVLAAALLWSYTLRQTVRRRTHDLRREIAERRQREEEIHAKNLELDEKNAELERFTYTVSHDLKSPLVTLKTFLGFLERDLQEGEPEQIKKDLGYMHGAADKMHGLLSDLLELSRVGRVEEGSESLAFTELAEAARDLVQGAIDRERARVRILPSALMLRGNRARLVEIWQNLLDNAVKYRHPEREPEIEIGVETTAEGPVFFVADNGRGIDPRYQEKIFGLFNQLDPSAPGSGLGLALVKRIVELYKGRIWVESDGESGSRFRFTLPETFKGRGVDEK